MAHADDPPLAERVAEALQDAGDTVAVTESCTGGLLGAALTAVPGASAYFDRSYVVYDSEAKLDLGVPREALDDHGAVSEPVALAMARAGRDAAGASWGVAATGIAGPSGGTAEKPVGTVHVAVAHAGAWGADDTYATAERYVFDGDRETVRQRTTQRALRDLLGAVEARE